MTATNGAARAEREESRRILRLLIDSAAPVEKKVSALRDAVLEHAEDFEARADAAAAERAEILRAANRGIATAQQNGVVALLLGEALERVEAKLDGHGAVLEAHTATLAATQTYAMRAAGAARRTEDARTALSDDEVQRIAEVMKPAAKSAIVQAGNVGAVRVSGAALAGALVAGLATQPVEVVKLLREIGPMWAAISVSLLFLGALYARLRRSK